MKNKYSAMVLIMSLASVGFSQTENYFVKPIETDTNYDASEDSNYVVRNTSANLNKLVLFIGGSFSKAKNYSRVCDYAAEQGFDAISLSYPNNVAAAPLGSNSDSLVFNKYRQELCFGTPGSDAVAVDTFNAIYTRTLKLIQYLALTYSSQNWGQYLATPNTLDWSKIMVGGHSQGAGHACYLGKYLPLERVLMFSGPNDYSTFYNTSANWLRQPGITPIKKHFVLLHLQDEVVPFEQQFTNIQGLGMLKFDDTTLVDIYSPPYNNSHALYTEIVGFSKHSSTIGAHPKMPVVWKYMLTADASTGIEQLDKHNYLLLIYPNPVHEIFTVKIPANSSSKQIKVYNAISQLLLSENIEGNSSVSIDLSNYANGVYFLQCENWFTKLIKE